MCVSLGWIGLGLWPLLLLLGLDTTAVTPLGWIPLLLLLGLDTTAATPLMDYASVPLQYYYPDDTASLQVVNMREREVCASALIHVWQTY